MLFHHRAEKAGIVYSILYNDYYLDLQNQHTQSINNNYTGVIFFFFGMTENLLENNRGIRNEMSQSDTDRKVQIYNHTHCIIPFYTYTTPQ